MRRRATLTPAGAAGYPVLRFASSGAWKSWLEKHHARERGIWLRIAKKGSGEASVGFAEALEVALCYGWIDGMARSEDDRWYVQKFTPRGRRSTWSKINRAKVERLIASGEMQPPGLAAIDEAKADGRWDRAYDSPATATIPPDLEAALATRPKARAFFETIKGANRFAILHRVQTAVKPETRARRIGQFVEMLERGETIY